jgi:hypothetical protein
MLYDPNWKPQQRKTKSRLLNFLRQKSPTPQILPPIPELNGWRKTLWDAADYIEDHGWCQFRLETFWGRVYSVPQVMLRKEVGGNIPSWNDSPNRTKQEVIATMRNLAIKGEYNVI